MVRRLLAIGAVCLALASSVAAQTRPTVGIRKNTPRVHAFVNARIVVGPGQVIESGTLVMRDGVIASVGAGAAPPADARVWDVDGLTLYPGLIESYATHGVTAPAEENGPRHWNDRVRPERTTFDRYKPEKKDLDSLRKLGFTAALVVPKTGIFRGTSTLVSLKDGDANEVVIRRGVAQHVRLGRDRGRGRRGGYPGSLMGIISLVRQTLLDAQWYRKAHAAYAANGNGHARPEENGSLAALDAAAHGGQPVVFEVSNELDFLRAARIAKEFNLTAWVRGSGSEYWITKAIKDSGAPVILPVNFPADLAVESPEEALGATLNELVHWHEAPANPRQLKDAGIPFVLTAAELKKTSDFHSRLRQALERGLTRDAALAALTTGPAKLLGVGDKLGTLDRGKRAHVVVTDGDLFAEKTKVLEVWIDGHRHVYEERPEVDLAGKWQLLTKLGGSEDRSLTLELEGTKKLSGTLVHGTKSGTKKVKVKSATMKGGRVNLVFEGKDLGTEGFVRMSGAVKKDGITGYGVLPTGARFPWAATLSEKGEAEPEKDKKAQPKKKLAPAMCYPVGAYGRFTKPEQPEHLLVRNATVWTCGPQGKMTNADLLVHKGKVVKVGSGLEAPAGATVIDAAGKHVTPGLIDCHSHTAMSGGGNEGGQAVSAEVRVADIVNSTDINIYRELAGGLTVMNILHGSANPIGGQNQVVKLRWGELPEDMKIEAAPEGIKFALGENVTRANSTRSGPRRYPATRMGVEQLIRDRFKAALDYERAWKEHAALAGKAGAIPPRRDLELDALLEIVRGKRLVHCHSYRQDEILMLVRVADDFGFRIGTFQHVLEGYKVAEAMAKHGAGGSSFSDWWAYKMEVYNAIPHNGALMHDAGVVVSFNSDSNELARRMNTEATKAVKYGGVSEVEALKFVTLNPAKQLGIDKWVGSLEAGKDADFVIWNGDPLSTYTMCLETWVDGKRYFSRAEDLKRRKVDEQTRAMLVQKLLEAGKGRSRKDFKKPEAAMNGEAGCMCMDGVEHGHDHGDEKGRR